MSYQDVGGQVAQASPAAPSLVKSSGRRSKNKKRTKGRSPSPGPSGSTSRRAAAAAGVGASDLAAAVVQQSKNSSSRSSPRPSLLDVETIYEGPGGPKSSLFLYDTTFVITNRAIEIEREGANAIMTVATLGCWYFFFQSASIEICELHTISKLHMQDDVIVATLARDRRGCCKKETQYIIDIPADQYKTTRDVFFELKEAWDVAHGNFANGESVFGDSSEDDEGASPHLGYH